MKTLFISALLFGIWGFDTPENTNDQTTHTRKTALPELQLNVPVASDCTFNGIPLYGKVQIVDAFPDIKVQIVNAFPDIKVKWVTAFADDCGKWQEVDAFPDFKIQIVDAFPDIKIQEVDAFPGMN